MGQFMLIHQHKGPTARMDSEMQLVSELFFRHVDTFESNCPKLFATFVAKSLLCQATQALGRV